MEYTLDVHFEGPEAISAYVALQAHFKSHPDWEFVSVIERRGGPQAVRLPFKLRRKTRKKITEDIVSFVLEVAKAGVTAAVTAIVLGSNDTPTNTEINIYKPNVTITLDGQVIFEGSVTDLEKLQKKIEPLDSLGK